MVYGVVDPDDPNNPNDPYDYHWLRLDTDGTWSQKHGMSSVETGELDPRTTGTRNTGTYNYTEDAGFFWVTPGNVNLGPTKPLMNVHIPKTYPAGYTGIIYYDDAGAPGYAPAAVTSSGKSFTWRFIPYMP